MKRIIVAAAAISVLAVPGAAHAAASQQIRPSDLVELPGVANGDGGQASHSFTGDGIAVDVPDANGSYVVLRWRANVPLSQVVTVDYDWSGTDNRPGIKYDVDGDGDGTVDCELIGEQAYGGTDVWLNKDTTDFTGSDLAQNATYCENAAPLHDGASGATDHGSLHGWSGRLGSNATIVYAGIGASDLVQQGVLTRVGLGATQYRFTNQSAQVDAPVVVDVTGSRVVHQTRHAVGFRFVSNAQPNGTTAGRDVQWVVTVNGHRRFTVSQGPGEKASYRFVNHNRRHAKVVRLFKNGAAVGRFVVGRA
ncbi:hypothetical protein D9V37_14300 [Nocardioides mangrovicus]|uniref:Uncharacterized protein n=1 Tax=Nocardioides mangrovicus TaxID=2478913 RepID=A0A3L8P0K3_9ACTN|nr:hypothetical protein [Nocardioides mangrovicus]RLV48541.1 hypothetical protein D9V37_14300 [Nocardioides mangrovicus]